MNAGGISISVGPYEISFIISSNSILFFPKSMFSILMYLDSIVYILYNYILIIKKDV